MVSAATNFVLYTDYVAPLPVHRPPATTSEARPATTAASDATGNSESDSSSGGSVDLPHIPHLHAHVCVGGSTSTCALERRLGAWLLALGVALIPMLQMWQTR